jgi:hypothetical protein
VKLRLRFKINILYNFADEGMHVAASCRKTLRHGAISFTSPPKEVVLLICISLKYPSPSAGLEPENLGSNSTLTTIPPRMTVRWLVFEINSRTNRTSRPIIRSCNALHFNGRVKDNLKYMALKYYTEIWGINVTVTPKHCLLHTNLNCVFTWNNIQKGTSRPMYSYVLAYPANADICQ